MTFSLLIMCIDTLNTNLVVARKTPEVLCLIVLLASVWVCVFSYLLLRAKVTH